MLICNNKQRKNKMKTIENKTKEKVETKKYHDKMGGSFVVQLMIVCNVR